MLQRRRSNSWQAEVRERRAEVSRYMQDPAYKKQVGTIIWCSGADHMAFVEAPTQRCSACMEGRQWYECRWFGITDASMAPIFCCLIFLRQVDEEKRARFKARKEQEVRLLR